LVASGNPKREHSRFKIPRFVQIGHWMIREPWQKIKDVFLESRRETPTPFGKSDAAADGGRIT
jgi:hypothetical protein